jgi:hypothetical protein
MNHFLWTQAMAASHEITEIAFFADLIQAKSI